MLKLIADERQLTARMATRLTTDSVGLVAKLYLSEDFDGLAVTVCFKAGDVAADVPILDGTEITVPSQCFAAEGEVLYAGVYASNAEGTIVIPTVWAQCGTIRKGTVPSGVDPQGPEPDWTASVLQAAADAVATANSVRADADAGVFDGYSPTATVEQLEDGATISITDKDGTTTATVHDGATGATGPAGFSPTATVTQTVTGATITIIDQSGTTTADISNGAPGEQGATGPQGPAGVSPTASVQRVEGGAEVTVTDASGTTTAMLYDATIEAGSVTDEMLAPDGIKQEVAWLWDNQLTGELTGEVLTASDAHSAPMLALDVLGKSEQESTTGKNLFDPDRTPRGYYRTDGEFSAGNNYVWWTVPVTEGDVVRWANCNNNLCTTYLDGAIVASYSDQRNNGTITIPAGVDEIRGYSGTGTLATAIVTKNNADLTYEPYTGGKPSPSPEYAQEIQSVENPVLTVAGKNLLPNGATSQTVSGVTFTVNDDGTVRANGTATSTAQVYIVPATARKSIPKGTYRLSGGSAVSAGIYVMILLYAPGSTTYTETRATLADGVTVNVPSDGYTFAALVRVTSGTVASNITLYPQLELGSTATAYEPYTGHTVALPVTLRSLPDGTKDELALTYLRPSTREGWAWYSGEVTRNVDVYTFPEGFDAGPQVDLGGGWYRYALYGRIRNLASNTYGLCDRTLYAIDGTIERVYVVGQAIVIQTQLATGAEVSEAFGGGHILYNCTPITETLDPIELPILPSEHVTMWATADATPTLNVEYVRDSNTVIASLEAAIADLATS